VTCFEGKRTDDGKRSQTTRQTDKERGIKPEKTPDKEADRRCDGTRVPLLKALKKHRGAQHKEKHNRRLSTNDHEDDLSRNDAVERGHRLASDWD
jgi:hypothetical protein